MAQSVGGGKSGNVEGKAIIQGFALALIGPRAGFDGGFQQAREATGRRSAGEEVIDSRGIRQ